MVLLIFGIAELAHSSAMLAVFIAGFVMETSRSSTNRASPTSTPPSQPSQISVCSSCSVCSFFRTTCRCLARASSSSSFSTCCRPAAVWIGTLGMGLPRKYKWFISWAGLEAQCPSFCNIPDGGRNGGRTGNIQPRFFVVILSVAIQGSTLGLLAKLLRLSRKARPKPLYNLELVTMARSDMDLFVFDVPGPQGAQGPTISDLRLPEGAVITLITRGEQVVPPKGKTRLLGWDQVTVLAKAADEPAIKEALRYFDTRLGQSNAEDQNQCTSADTAPGSDSLSSKCH